MTDRPKYQPDDETVAKWVRELPAVEPDSGFRERLRSAFTSGDIEHDERGAETQEQPQARRRGAPRRRWWGWAVPAVVAAAAVFALVTFNSGPALEVLEVTGSSAIVIDGQRVDAKDAGAMRAALRAGVEVEVPAGTTVDLAVAGTVIYELTGGTRMTIPDSPGRWFGRAVECGVMVGELRLKTGARFKGSELRVFTPDGIVVVTGTLLSVQCDEGGTCVCVLEGTARVGIDSADLEPVTPGNRKIMLRDGTVDIIPVKPMHRDGVLDFDRRVGDRLR